MKLELTSQTYAHESAMRGWGVRYGLESWLNEWLGIGIRVEA
jgi:hypothetical protein